ncbi:MAG: CBS domain-containing protein [Salibacteraceae bacterium]|nr:CBS domain-containing protein [Salibacteraceae bacterium]
MKISASIYSDAARPLQAVIADLVAHQVDLLHIDCNDDLSVFKDIKLIRSICHLPLDLHIITSEPEKFYPYLVENPVEYLTFQAEPLHAPIKIPQEITAKKGLSVITPTPISAFDAYQDFDFILIMATIPGQSGGVFDRLNFDKIRNFRKQYPNKSIHVDGGVNPEVSFILRQMGVSTAVSGSYLFKEASVGNALMNLTQRSIGSTYKVADFMTPLHETPRFNIANIELQTVLQTVEDGQMGVAMAVDNDHLFKGLVSSADIRKALLQQLTHGRDLNELDVTKMINKKPIYIKEDATVLELLQLIKNSPFAVLYLPVIDANMQLRGIVQFSNLIKAEI